MYKSVINSPQTELVANIDNGQTSIELVDATVLATAPNLMTIMDSTNTETVLYTNIVGNTVSGCTRAFQGLAQSFSVDGTKISRNFTAYDYDTLMANIQDNAIQLTDYSSFASVKDGVVYTVIDFKRSDSTEYLNSVLSNKDTNGYFQTCSLNYYSKDGTTIIRTVVWTFTNDADGNIITKEVA